MLRYFLKKNALSKMDRIKVRFGVVDLLLLNQFNFAGS